MYAEAERQKGRASENHITQGRGGRPLFPLGLDQRLMETWPLSLRAATQRSSQPSGCCCTGSFQLQQVRFRGFSSVEVRPSSNETFPTVVSSLERHFPQVLRRKKTFLRGVEFRRADFAVCSFLPPIILVLGAGGHFWPFKMLRFSVIEENSPSLSPLVTAAWRAESQ